MKTRSIARGIVGSVAALLGVMAAGCSADVSDPQSGEAEIGSTAEALALSPALAPSLDVQFGGYFTIPNTSKTVWLGGYDRISGTGTTIAGIFDPSLGTSPDHRWQTLTNALPASLGEVEIAQLEQTLSNGVVTAVKLLVSGGRGSRDGAAVQNTYILSLSGTDLLTAAWTTLSNTNDLNQARVIGKGNLQKCGTSKFIAIGGMTDKGMENVGLGMAATDVIEVFTYDSTTLSNSKWETLKRSSDGTTQVKLNTGRGYHEVLHVSDTDFRIAGGANASTVDALATVEKLLVNASCQATNQDANNKVPLINSMPSARARMSSIAKSITFTPTGGSSTTFDFALAGGTDASGTAPWGAPTDIFFYKASSDTWEGITKDITVGRVFPHFSNYSGSSIALVTGVKPDNVSTLFADTTNVVETISTAGVTSTATALATDRVGAFVTDAISSTPYTGFGSVYSGGSPSAAANSVESF